jgi:hypothetical protein
MMVTTAPGPRYLVMCLAEDLHQIGEDYDLDRAKEVTDALASCHPYCAFEVLERTSGGYRIAYKAGPLKKSHNGYPQ